MKDWFEEKTHQVEQYGITAFGIPLTSRYHKADEIISMLQFAQSVARRGVAHYVTGVDYDSKATICGIETADTVSLGDPVHQQIHAAAMATLSQFMLLGDTEIGNLE
ncbi:hypothetical protein [Alloalcanivorax xenomutans]|uniref:Uncharacterized protein n=1 Tax=Alloalcanivorax xenomutans TaxID=1094342 RepID=A0A9Q3ZDZ0_9GAMM|nr:hypothetical protein [Alloalcanivorax xenomutans]MCE7510268.1 hypothetical protein [Alloalcanivorax xenomutans]